MLRMKTVVVAVSLIVLAAVSGPAQSRAGAAFDRLKTLAGEWEGKSTDGQPVRVSYRLLSADTVLLETIKHVGEAEMITAYHRDGDSVLMTHYCTADNQPRMRARASAAGAGQIDFTLVDVSNLSKPAAGHMRRLVLTFADADHLDQKWTWTERGKDTVEEFRLSRIQ